MDVIVTNRGVYGEFESLSSKSDFLRLLLCSLFSCEPTKIVFNNDCDDIKFGINAAKSLGITVLNDDNGLTFYNQKNKKDYAEINCGESGALLRFLMPCANNFCKTVKFTGNSSLASRPIKGFIELLSRHGLKFSNNKLPFEVSGKLKSGDYYISGDVSSQFVSGLLFILPVLEGDSKIIVTSKLESEKYVDLTIKRLLDFGIKIIKEGKEILIPGGQNYKSAGEYKAEGDWSYAAALMCVGASCGEVFVKGLDLKSVQPDKRIMDIFKDIGVDVECRKDGILVKKSVFNGIVTDLSGCPDLFPVLAALLSCAESESTFYGTKRLIYKESNRLYSVSTVLNELGANVEYSEHSVKINPVKKLKGGQVSSFNDHRVVMAATVAAKMCERDVKIMGADCVKKSALGFLEVIDSCTRSD